MSYDLAVWEGDRPASDEAATNFYDEQVGPVVEDYVPGVSDAPPTSRIRAYIKALLERWPDEGLGADENNPWGTNSLLDDASGWFVYLTLSWGMAEEVSAFAADLARQHGLVCYDPQLERLRPEACSPSRPL